MNRSPYELIASNDDSLWREGLDALSKEHSEKAALAIISLLSDRSWHKREAASKTLINWGNGVEALLAKNVSEQNVDQYYWSLFVLGHIGGDIANNVLKKGLQNKDSELRSYAVRGLGFVKKIENARALYPVLNDSNWSIRKLAFVQLLSFGELILDDLRHIISTPSKIPNHSIIALFVHIGKDNVIPELIKFYKEGNFALRFTVVSVLGELGTPRAIDFLIGSLSDPSWAIRKLACEQLIKLGSKAFDQLTASFGRVDSLIRHDIIKIIVNQITDKSMPLLKRLLAAPDLELKMLAIENMARLRSDAATAELINCLSEPDRIISDFAADCLTKKSNLNLELLLAQLNTEDENLRFQIIKVIGSIGGLAFIPIIRILEKGNKQEKLFLLGVLQKISPDSKVIDMLIKLLGDENWPIRNAASNCLVSYGESSVSSIVKALNSNSDDIRYWARRTLVLIGPKAVSTLIHIMEDGTEAGLIPHIVSALLSMNNPEAVPAVIKFLENNDEYRIEAVFSSIPSVTSKDVVNTVLNLLTHPEEKVAKWLSQILKKADAPFLHRTVFLGLSHSNDMVRFYVTEAIAEWQILTEADLKVLCRQLQVEKNIKNLHSLISCLAKHPSHISVDSVGSFLENCPASTMLDLMLEASSHDSPEFADMLKEMLNKRSDLITINDVDRVGSILGNLYKQNPNGLIKGLGSESKAYRMCCVIALDSFEDRKLAFDLMDNLLENEEVDVIQRAVKVLSKFFFYDDFRLKGALTDFFLNLGKIITEPLTEYIQTLENEFDKKAIVDLIESVGGEVSPDVLRSKGAQKVMLSDNHLDEVLEKRRMALEEIEKYDELIKESHTKELSIMFTDVKGFTAFSSKASLSEVMSMLKQHDEILKPVFEKYGGEALKKIGDAFLVVFENHNNALLAGMEIQRKLVEYNDTVPQERKLAIRITINTGSVIRTENDVMGDPVNLASRLEGITDAFEIVISEFTLAKIDRSIFELEPYGAHEFKGISRPIETYKVRWNR